MLSSPVTHFVNNMTFKIFAALFVACIAQGLVSAGIFDRDKPAVQDETELSFAQSVDLRSGNSYLCITIIPETFTIVSEFRILWTKYEEVKEIVALLKAKCDKLDEDGAKDQCFNAADQTYADKSSEIVKKMVPILPRLLTLAKNYQICLFGE